MFRKLRNTGLCQQAIQNNVSVYEGVTLEDYVFCGPSMVFTNVTRPRSAYPTGPEQFADTHVAEGATLGANCTVLCGSRVGRWSFVAAGAVVTKDVEPFSLVVGVPGKHIGWVSRAGHRLAFHDGEADCPETGQRYALQDGAVIELGGPGAAREDPEQRSASLADVASEGV